MLLIILIDDKYDLIVKLAMFLDFGVSVVAPKAPRVWWYVNEVTSHVMVNSAAINQPNSEMECDNAPCNPA